jgi:hypothetical protein
MILNGEKEDTAKRFWNKVLIKTKDECWLWTGAKTRKYNGYGLFWPERRTTRTAHSVAFELTYGYKPKEDVHHTCRVRLCCNPNHLDDLTRKEHMQETFNITFCAHGHEYTKENTYIKPNGCRDCKQCKKDRKLKAR